MKNDDDIKKEDGEMKRKIFPDVKILALMLLGVIAFSVSFVLLQDNKEAEIFEAENLESDGVQRAVIIDQLYDDIPRDWFHQQASDRLKAAGYNVDIFTTQDITVDFYKKLPTMNYKFIVIRTHGVEDKNNDSVDIFTGERYQEDKYIAEQLFGQVIRGAPLQQITFEPNTNSTSGWNIVNDTYREMITPVTTHIEADDDYFLITPKFVDELMVGKFPGSTFVIGACSSLGNISLAESLVNRGASFIVGWDGTVGDWENDMIMIQLLEETLIKNIELNEAVNLVMERYDWGDPTYNATLKYYHESNL